MRMVPKFGQFISDPSGFNVGWENRNFLRTGEQGYGNVSFIAYVTAQRDFVPVYGIDGYGAVYFGVGSGDARSYRTPDGDDNGTLTNASIFFKWQAQEYISWHAGVKGLGTNVPEIGFAGEPAPRKQGTTRLLMAYDSVAKTATYAIDYEYNGSFVADQTTTFDVTAVANEFAGGERSSIYFGSNGEVSFSDFSVQVLPAGPTGPVSISNDLKGYDGNNTTSAAPPFLTGSGLEPTNYGADPSISFLSSGALFGGSSWPGRNFLRTSVPNYGTVGFTAYVTAQRDFVATGGPDGDGAVYFGLGSAEARYFRTPDGADGADGPFLTQSSTFFKWQANPYISWHAQISGQSDNNITEIGYADEPGPDRKQGTTRLSMTYNPVVKTISYGIDYDYNGTFEADQTSPVIDVTALVDEFNGGERSSIYFGSNAGVSFSDFSIDVAGTVSPYQEWAGGAPFDGDANDDGVANGLAWVLGAANPDAIAIGLLPESGAETGFSTLSFQRLADLGSVDLWVEFSSDLGISDPWTAVNILAGPFGDVVVTDDPGIPLNNVVVKIPTGEAAASGRLFSRIKATQP